MKKLIPLLILVGGAASGFAQGTISFRNFDAPYATVDPTGGNRNVYDVGSPLNPATGVGLTGTQYVAELYAGTDASSLQPLSLSISRFRSTTTSNKGKWGTSTLLGVGNDRVLLPVDFGGTAFLQVKVWDYSTSQTFAGASGKTGVSMVFTYKVPPAGDLTASDFFMENFQAFALVPEPSAIALGVIGVAGLLLLRRRK